MIFEYLDPPDKKEVRLGGAASLFGKPHLGCCLRVLFPNHSGPSR